MSLSASAQQAQPAGPAVSDGELWKNTVHSLLNFDEQLIADLRHALHEKDLPPSSRQEILLKAMGYNPPWTRQNSISYLTDVMYIDTDTVKLQFSLLQGSSTEALHTLVRIHHTRFEKVLGEMKESMTARTGSAKVPGSVSPRVVPDPSNADRIPSCDRCHFCRISSTSGTRLTNISAVGTNASRRKRKRKRTRRAIHTSAYPPRLLMN